MRVRVRGRVRGRVRVRVRVRVRLRLRLRLMLRLRLKVRVGVRVRVRLRVRRGAGLAQRGDELDALQPLELRSRLCDSWRLVRVRAWAPALRHLAPG